MKLLTKEPKPRPRPSKAAIRLVRLLLLGRSDLRCCKHHHYTAPEPIGEGEDDRKRSVGGTVGEEDPAKISIDAADVAEEKEGDEGEAGLAQDHGDYGLNMAATTGALQPLDQAPAKCITYCAYQQSRIAVN